MSINMRIIVVGVLLLIGVDVYAQVPDKTEREKQIAKTIQSEDLKGYLTVLASDSLEGRETGFPGQKMAAEFIKNHFDRIGLRAPVRGGFYQPFPIVVETPGGARLQLNGKELDFTDDFFYLGSFDKQLISGNDMVFVGYGIEEDGWNDYEGVEVSGKVAVVLNGEPMDGENYVLTGEEFPSAWTRERFKKINLLKEKGAVAVLVLLDNYREVINGYRRFVMRKQTRLVEENKRDIVPFFYANEEKALSLLEKNDRKYIVKYKKKGKPASSVLESGVEINVVPDIEERTAENVLGYLEGRDKKDEVIVITAHYDHLGKRDGKIFNGADDDGSGTSAVLELAEAFAAARDSGWTPRRSILFMTVSGEEKGLLGSQFYADSDPVFPLENTVANLNIDMIGRIDEHHEGNPDYVYLIGSDKLSSQLHEISEEANESFVNLALDYTYNAPDDPNRFYYRSDHYNFAKNNIPVIFYFNGTHEDYHQETDTVEKIHFEKMEKITRLVFHTAWELANREERITVDTENEFSNDR